VNKIVTASMQKKRLRATKLPFMEKELSLIYAIENNFVLENKEFNAVSSKNKNK